MGSWLNIFSITVISVDCNLRWLPQILLQSVKVLPRACSRRSRKIPSLVVESGLSQAEQYGLYTKIKIVPMNQLYIIYTYCFNKGQSERGCNETQLTLYLYYLWWITKKTFWRRINQRPSNQLFHILFVFWRFLYQNIYHNPDHLVFNLIILCVWSMLNITESTITTQLTHKIYRLCWRQLTGLSNPGK